MLKVCSLLAATLVAGAASAQMAQTGQPEEPATLKLTVGDKAPAIDIQHWIKGNKVARFETGKVYVLEFWATWCGPCRAGMPHISEVQEKYKDYGVTIIGVSDEDLPTVKGFLDKPDWAQKTRYTLATDPDGSTAASYMEAALQNGIPTAFIIGKDSTVQWIGHPMGMDEPLDQIVKDQWDVKAFKSKFEADMKMEIELSKRSSTIRAAMKAKDWDTALTQFDELSRLFPEDPMFKVEKFKILIGGKNDPKSGYALGREIIASSTSNPMVLNELAWHTVDHADVKKRDFDFALEAALKADEASKHSNAAILDTLARVYFEKGDFQKAVETQKAAVANAAPGAMADELAKTLAKYQEKAGH